MKSASYKVTFYKKASEEESKDEFLGQVVVDDIGVSQNFTLVAKAFRLATSNCLLADKTITERV